MPAVYQRMGVRFLYPENWGIDEGEAFADRQSVSVVSPGGAFWTLAIYPPGEEPQRLADSVRTALGEEYDSLDSEAVSETMAGWDLVGHDMNFFFLDLVCTAAVRVATTPAATYVIHYQAEDREFEELGDVFRAITTSLLQPMT